MPKINFFLGTPKFKMLIGGGPAGLSHLNTIKFGTHDIIVTEFQKGLHQWAITPGI
jgi:hypothetical protein